MSTYTGFSESLQVTGVSAEDEAAIQQLFQRMMDAWAAGDAVAYGEIFTEDADYVAFDGVNQKGRTAIIDGHKPLFERFVKGSRLTGGLVSLRQLAPGMVLVHGVGSILDAGRTTPKPERLSSQTLLAVKQGDAWRFTAFHNTRVRPIGLGAGFLAWLLADLAWRLFGTKPKQ
jgi:uncharacterized protein (TIGR02246 family)